MDEAVAIAYREEYGNVPLFLCVYAFWKLGPTGRMMYYPCTAKQSYCPLGAKADKSTCDSQLLAEELG